MKTLNLGLIGVGRIGTMHANNLNALRPQLADRGLEVNLWITDVAADYARIVAAGLGATFFDSVNAMIEAGVDALLIATGTMTHPDLIRAGIAANLPVFCEKPVAGDVESALPLLEEIAASNGRVQIGHQRRFDAGYLEAKRRLDAGDLGWIHTMRAVTGDMVPPSLEFIATSGGLFRDCSVHDFDILRWLTGKEIVEVYAKGSNNGDPGIGAAGDVDTALAVLTFDDGTVATASATRYNGAGHDVRLEIQGSKSTVVVGLDEQSAMHSAELGVEFPTGTSHQTFIERFDGAYRAEMVAFIEYVLGERENPCSAWDAVAASRVADAAQESLLTGAPVAINPVPVA
ncbi:Gfo/Idh/MocA family oxidoreductase [Paeniglutamicibacter terrestris]|uniref:Gfo/Idh/MocA family oxidoreductase n=1 Tax=Paeniglutamicibacter terrestris TaxID=2723403 RepID=A0ABX1G5W0_9MICC|nr:Gfo/Idh/MocA family oxidoreductase [Paeniglutamicibacter terrestris]NKG21642.1 Gfo/Idh/MocA family oxidoreductase [Paeniglutamicibacter terrestris]